MAPPFIKMTQEQFSQAISSFNWTTPKTEIHVHHTWRPNHAQYQGFKSIQGMYDYHVNKKKWSDIAQHISIGPDGSIWTGRPWNQSPASALGNNGSHVFMFETIGDFDIGKDPFSGEQMETVMHVVASLQIFFGLPLWWSVRFHNQMSSKSCPGSAIDRSWFIKQVEKKRKELESNSFSLFANEAVDLESILPAIADSGPVHESTSLDEGSCQHDLDLEQFMAEYHKNPFVSSGASLETTLGQEKSEARSTTTDAIKVLLEHPVGLSEAEVNNKLFIELGHRVAILEADPSRAGELELRAGAELEGFLDYFSDLGQRLFSRWEQELHKLLCGNDANSVSDRAKIRDGLGLGQDQLVAALVGVLVSSFGLAQALAVVLIALLIRIIFKPTYHETCQLWSVRLGQG